VERYAGETAALRQASERPRFPFAAVVRVRAALRLAVVKMAVPNRVEPAAWKFFPEALAFPAEKARARFALAASDSAAAQRRRAADNGNSGFEAPAAARYADIDSPNTAAGIQAAAQTGALSFDSSYPIRADAAPMHYPSARPSAAVSERHPRKYTGGYR
jgi:hypothetical protein